jgi:hypothetical protein
MEKKGFLFGFVVFVILIAANASYAQTKIDGFWEEVGLADCLVLWAQEGNTVYIMGTYTINGAPRVWHGTGLREGNTLTYTYEITFGSAKGKLAGKGVLKISPDGMTLTGNNVASNGTSSSVTMKRKSS